MLLRASVAKETHQNPPSEKQRFTTLKFNYTPMNDLFPEPDDYQFIALPRFKQEELLWQKLKELNEEAGWKSSFNDRMKMMFTPFEVKSNLNLDFQYHIFNGYFSCFVWFAENFPNDVMANAFILAQNLNNTIIKGKIVVDSGCSHVHFSMSREVVCALLNPDDIYGQMELHYSLAKEIFLAFERLFEKRDRPSIIINDVYRKNLGKGLFNEIFYGIEDDNPDWPPF